MVTTLKPISLTPSMGFGDFKSFGEMRFIIILKWNKLCSNLLDVWVIETYHWLIKNEERKRINNIHNPKVHYVILTLNPKVLDGCLNDDLSWNQLRKRKRCMDSLCDPKVPFIILTWNLKVLDGRLNKRLIIGSYEYDIRKRCTKGLCGPKIHFIISLHKTQAFWMDVWIKDSSLDLVNVKWTINNNWDYST